MNTSLQIPTELQAVLDQIENTPLHLAEMAIADHPKLPGFNRKIRVYDIDAKSKQQLVVFQYAQVLVDKETGEESQLKLPTPDWVVYADTWSYFRGQDGQIVELPINPDIEKQEGIDTKIRVPSYKYMLWLMKNNQAGFLQLIQGYLNDFVINKIEELNKL